MPSLLIDIGANIARLQTDMAKAQTQITTFAKSAEGAFASLGSIAAAAGVTAGVGQMVTAFMDAERAAMKMAVAMKNQGDYSKRAFEDLQAFTKEIQRTTAAEDDATLAIMANLKTYGMTNEEVKKATVAVLNLAAAKQDEGVTTERASETIGKAYMGQTAALKKMGIVVDENIPTAQKYAAIMDQVQQRFGGAAQAELETYSGQWKKLKNDFGDVAEVLGIGVLKGLEGAMFGFSMVSVAFYKTLESVSSGIGWFYEKIGKGANLVGMTETAKGAAAIAEQMNGSAAGYAAIKEEALRMADANHTAMMSFDNVDKAMSKMRDGTRTKPPIDSAEAKKLADELKRMQDEDRKGLIAGLQAQMDEWDDFYKSLADQAQKNTDLQEKLRQEDLKNLIDGIQAQMDADDAYYTSLGKNQDEAEKKAKARGQAERDIYSDIRGYETEAFNASIVLIDEQAKKYREMGVDEVAVSVWVAEEHEKAELKKLKASENFTDGVSAGYREMLRDQMTFGKAGADLFKTFSTSSKTAVSSILFDGIKKGSIDTGAIFESFTDSMLKNFTDSVGQMASESATKGIKLVFESAWKAGGSDVLKLVSSVVGLAGSAINWASGYDIGSIGGNYSDGGRVDGSARFPGDHPGNDTVPAWLSPGEVVIRRTAVNPDTEAILDYINRHGQPPAYAFGGRVMNTVTDTPGRGYFGFDDFVSIATGGASDVFGVTDSSTGRGLMDFLNPGMMSAEKLYQSIQNGDWAGVVDAAFDPITGPGITNLLNGSGKFITPSMPWVGELIDTLAPIIGGIVGGIYGGPVAAAGGAAAGSGIASKFNRYSDEDAVTKAAITAAVSYASSAAGQYVSGAVGGTSGKIAGAMANKAAAYGAKWLINEALGSQLSDVSRGSLNLSLIGAEDGGLMASLASSMKDIAPRSDPFKFSIPSYQDGTDYVPRTGPALIHEGEKITPAGDNKGGSIGEIHIYLDGQEIDGKMKIIADGVVVERNQRNVLSTRRIYS